ncbi:MAG TPA: hypothetical protein VJ044_07550, partial [Candidatus Hodarchaeales archaeon]|nr:hypothetical protein [Candidatus Hodarchaeales archaeon]
MKRSQTMSIILVTASLLVVFPMSSINTEAQIIDLQPAVSVNDQSTVNNTVTIARAVSSGPGWIVIHLEIGGAPLGLRAGPSIGWTHINHGENYG